MGTTGTKFTSPRKYVLAGDHKQFEYLMRALRVTDRYEYTYVASGLEHLQGTRGGILFKYGTWYERKDAQKIIDFVKICDFKIFTIGDD